MFNVLDFAVFVLFPAALAVFIFGASYRILKYAFLYKKGVYINRNTSIGHKIKGLIMTFLRPVIFSAKTHPIEFTSGFIFMHIVGLIILIFLLGQHIAYLQTLIPFYGLLWPFAVPTNAITGAIQYMNPAGQVVTRELASIWGPLTIILNGDFLTLFSIIGVGYKMVSKLIEKAKEGAQRVRWGDLLIWPLLLGILVTGWLATHHVMPTIEGYRLVLGLHIAFAATFVAVWPFTKYFHFLWGYWYGKLHEWYDMVIKRGV